MKATIIKIEPRKFSRTENEYVRIKLRLDDGRFAMTDVVPAYRNFAWWKPVIEAGEGTKVDSIFLKQGYGKILKVDADSQVVIIKQPLPLKAPDQCCESFKIFGTHALSCQGSKIGKISGMLL